MHDKMIIESPVVRLKKGWKRPQKPVRMVPTQQQFEALVASIGAQEQNGEAEESADFVEFVGLAGLGQAEASSTTLEDVDWARARIRVRRRKTGELFYVPIYPHLKIAKWQGHQDGGKLILDSYTEVSGAKDEAYEKIQLAKIT